MMDDDLAGSLDVKGLLARQDPSTHAHGQHRHAVPSAVCVGHFALLTSSAVTPAEGAVHHTPHVWMPHPSTRRPTCHPRTRINFDTNDPSSAASCSRSW